MKLVVSKESLLLDYLYNNLDMPKKRIKQYLKYGSIFINNHKSTKFDEKIYPNDIIVIDTNSKNTSNLAFDILFEDNNIIVVNKPSGLLTIATAKEKEKTLYHMISEYLKTKNKNNKVFVVHRLDKDTSGIVIFSKDMKTKNLLQDNWNDIVKLREYVAIVHGNINKKEDTIKQKLKQTKTNLVYVTKDIDGKEAITHYKVIKENEEYSELEIKIETGRKNQIRVALASINHPIVGDKKYGIKDNANRLYLHANRLKIYYPILKKEILFETKIPSLFRNYIK